MASSTPSVSDIVTAVTLKVTSAGTPSTVEQTFNDPATLASLKVGIPNSLRITNSEILSRYATVGLQCSNVLSVTYGGLISVSTPTSTPIFVATPITLSNFGPFTYNFVSGGTFTLPQPSSNSNSPGAFTYSVPANNGVVSISGNVVTMLAAGSTTITAIQNAAGGYASSTPIDANVTVQSNVSNVIVTPNVFFETSNDNFIAGSGFPQDVSTMTFLFYADDASNIISVPSSYGFSIKGVTYTDLYVSSNNMLSFGGPSPGWTWGNHQNPTSTYRYLSSDTISTIYYKFSQDNTKIYLIVESRFWAYQNYTFVVRLIIHRDGLIETNFEITGTSNTLHYAAPVVVGYVGNNAGSSADDIYLTVNGATFNGQMIAPYPLLHNKTFGIKLTL
jgi:hypothetical protein